MYFKAAFDQFIKFESDGVRFLKSVWYFGDVKIYAVVRTAGKDEYQIMTKEYYDADQLKIYQAFEQKLVPINTSISGINGEILTIKTNITHTHSTLASIACAF